MFEIRLEFQEKMRWSFKNSLGFPPLPLLHYWHVHAYRSHHEFVFVRNFIILGSILGFSRGPLLLSTLFSLTPMNE